MPRLLAVAVLALATCEGFAMNVFACEPEWAALVAEIAAEEVTVTIATTASQDPHHLQARPSLIAAVRRADLLICTGADLEIGWLPLLLRRSGNPKIQPGAAGYLLAADFVRKIELPARLDRAEGDIHPQGNPHLHLHPRSIRRVAIQLSARLSTIAPAQADDYRDRLDNFLNRWDEAVEQWEKRGEALAGMRLVSHHRSFSYLADWLNLDIVATLEPKPGIPATTSHLAALLDRLKPDPPAAIVRTPYSDPKPSRWLSRQLNAPEFSLPFTVGGSEQATDLFGLYESTFAMLEEAGS